MPGALLKDDWQRAVEDELRKYAQGISQTAQSAVQVVQGVPRPDPNQVMDELQTFAGGLLQAPQRAQQGIVQLGADVQQSAQDVNAQLTSYAQGLYPAQQPQPQPIAVPQEPDFAPPPLTMQPPTTGVAPARVGQGQQDFVSSLLPLAQRVAARTGIDPNVMIAIAANETGWGQSSNARQQNNLFSIQGPSGRASRWATYDSPEQSFEAFVDLISTAPRYKQAWASRDDPDRFVDELRRAGYVADEPGFPAQGWVDQVKGINRRLPGISGQPAAAPRDPNVALSHSEEPASATDTVGNKWKTQFDFHATYTGNYRTGTPHRGIDLVPQKGGIGTSIEAFHPGTVTQVSRDTGGAGGLMVYVRDRDGLTHAYMHLQSAGVKVGDVVNRGQPIATMGESGTEGSPHLHYEVRRNLNGDPLNALIDPRPYMRGGEALRQVGATAPSGAQQAAQPDQPWTTLSAGQQRPAPPPIYLQQNQPSAIQTIGSGLENARQSVGGFFSDVGSGARQLQQDVEPARAWIAGESQAAARAQGYSPQQQAEAKRIVDQQRQRQVEIEQQGITPGTIAGGAWNMLIQNPSSTGIQLDDYMRIEGQKNDWIEQNNPAKQLTTMGVPVVEGLTTMVAQQLTSPLVIASFGPTVGLGVKGGAAATEALLSRGAAEWVANVAGKFTAGAITNGLQNAIFEASQPGADPGKVGMAIILGAGLGGTIDAGTPAVKAAARFIGREVSDAVRDQATRDALMRFATEPQRGEANVDFALGGIPSAVDRIRGRGAAEAVTPPAQEATPAAPTTIPTPSVEPVRPPAEIPAPRPPSGVARPFNYQADTPEFRFNEAARASAAASPDGLAHVDLNTLGPAILPFDPVGGGTRRIKTMPGGMPSLDNLRRLADTSLRQRDFYADQADDAAALVGDNIDEWLAVNSMTSAQTPLRDQMAEAIQTMGTVREVAARAIREGKDVETEIVKALRSKEEMPLMSYTHPQKREFMVEGYTTGVSPVKGAPKTPSFAGNYDSALKRQFDPRITNDTWDWQIMNVSDDLSPTFGAERIAKETALFEGPGGPRDVALKKAQAKPATTPKEIAAREKAIQKALERTYKPPMQRRHFNNAANDDTAYRGVEAVFNELAAERGMDGYQMQSLLWSGIRHLFSDDELQALWKAGQFDEAIRLGEERGVFSQKLGGEIDEAINDPKVQAALQRWGHLLKEPAPLRGQGMRRSYAGETQSKPAARPARPSTAEFRSEERAFMEAGAPVIRGLDQATVEQLGLDPEKGFFPWLTASHRVTEAQPGEYVVHLPAGNEDTARYVAGVIGQASNAESVPLNIPDARVTDRAGVAFRGTVEEVDALKGALDNMGIAAVKGSEGRALQVPFETVNDQALEDAVQDAALSVGLDDSRLGVYSGKADYVQRSDYASVTEAGAAAFGPTTPGRRDLLERGVGGLPPQEPGFTAPGGAEPPGGGGLRRSERGEADVPFSLNLGGAALGGYAGYAATPEDADWSERARNVGLGATAGLLGTRAITGGGGRQLARAVAGMGDQGARRPPPIPTRGGDILEARRSGVSRGPRDIPEPEEPGSLGEVHSNNYLLRKAGEGDTPLTDDELMAHYDALDERMTEVKSRAEAVDEVLRNPIQRPYRPPWAAGYTNDALIEIARRNNISPYQEQWWDAVGLESGSGEVRWDVGESGLRGTGKVEPTPTELRAERNALAQEERDLLAAAEQLGAARPEDQWVRRPIRGAAVESGDLPFDAGSQEAAPSGPFATEVSGPSGNLAEDIVTKNGTVKPRDPLAPKPGLSEDAAGVVGRGEVKGRTVTGRGVTDPTAVPDPSARARKIMPNLDAMLGDNMPEVRAQIEQAVNDNIELFEAHQQGRISHDSMVHDLATKVGMSKKEFLATPVGKGFNTAETVALQAAAIESQQQQRALAASIEAAGGVDKLSPEQVAWGLSSLLDAARLTSVAAGARSTAGRTLNALKIRIDAAMSKAISASNEVISANRIKDQAKRAEVRAKKLLESAKEMDTERATVAKAATAATEAGHPSARGKGNIWQQIDDAYNDLDRYQAMSLHEKADDFDKLARERAERAAKRKEAVRAAPDELLSALKAELKAERDIFAGRKNTWEDMAFWDSKAGEIAAQKRADFRGGLYIEQQRKAANEALKKAEADFERAWKAESGRQTRQTERAVALLERIGGVEPTKELLASFVKAINSPDDLAAAKFLKGMQDPGWWGKATILRLAGLLSSTATHAANAVGNVTQPLIEIPSHALTVGIDWARVAKNGGERQAYWAELGPMLEAYGPGVLASWDDFRTVLRTGIAPTDLTDLSRVRAGFKSGSDVVDTIAEGPLRMLSAMDVLFRGGAFAMHANRVATRYAVGEGFGGAARRGRAADIVAHLEEYPELYQEAYDAAARMVFQEKRGVGISTGYAKGVPGALQRGAVSQVLPFVKTPMNITAQGFGMTPLGFLGVGEAILNRPNVAASKMGRQTLLAEERAARATIGTLIMGGFMALGAGTLTGGKSMLTAGYPTDPGEASTLPPGWREWSMRVEDGVTGNVHYVPFQNFGAAGVPMAMAALLTDSGKRNRGLVDGDEMTRAMTGVGAYVLDNTFLQGLSDTINVLHSPERYAPRFVEGLVASYGPYSAMGRQMQRAYGVAARNPREGFQGMVDALISSYPGASGLVPEATTALGEPRGMGVSGIGAFASPVRSSLEQDEPTLKALRDNDVNLSAPSKELSLGRGQAVELTEAEQDTLKRIRGEAIRRNVAAAQQGRAWQSAPPGRAGLDTRNAVLRDALQHAVQSSKADFLRGLGAAEIEARRKAAREIEPTYIGGGP